MKYSWVAAIAFVTLSACGDEAAEPISTETGGEAAGEILGGTISDEMIPLEELTSTSPPAERRQSASSRNAPSANEEEAAPEGAASEPEGPITAGPGRPVAQAEETGEPTIDPPAF
jgi:hypothetical protein